MNTRTHSKHSNITVCFPKPLRKVKPKYDGSANYSNCLRAVKNSCNEKFKTGCWQNTNKMPLRLTQKGCQEQPKWKLKTDWRNTNEVTLRPTQFACNLHCKLQVRFERGNISMYFRRKIILKKKLFQNFLSKKWNQECYFLLSSAFNDFSLLRHCAIVINVKYSLIPRKTWNVRNLNHF